MRCGARHENQVSAGALKGGEGAQAGNRTYSNLGVFGVRFVVVVVVDGGVEDVDLVVGDVREDALFEGMDLLVGEGV